MNARDRVTKELKQHKSTSNKRAGYERAQATNTSKFTCISLTLQRALDEGEWGRMNARDRGALMYQLANKMDAHRGELATLET